MNKANVRMLFPNHRVLGDELINVYVKPIFNQFGKRIPAQRECLGYLQICTDRIRVVLTKEIPKARQGYDWPWQYAVDVFLYDNADDLNAAANAEELWYAREADKFERENTKPYPVLDMTFKKVIGQARVKALKVMAVLLNVDQGQRCTEEQMQYLTEDGRAFYAAAIASTAGNRV